MDRKEIAIELYKSGFNCAQAVACAFANVLAVDPIDTYRMAEPFGFGMGDGEGPCGALSGACMMVGAKKSDGDMDDPKTKRMCYNTIMMMKKEFEQKAGSTICRDIKGREQGKMNLSCIGCIETCVELLDRYLLGIYEDDAEADDAETADADEK